MVLALTGTGLLCNLCSRCCASSTLQPFWKASFEQMQCARMDLLAMHILFRHANILPYCYFINCGHWLKSCLGYVCCCYRYQFGFLVWKCRFGVSFCCKWWIVASLHTWMPWNASHWCVAFLHTISWKFSSESHVTLCSYSVYWFGSKLYIKRTEPFCSGKLCTGTRRGFI